MSNEIAARVPCIVCGKTRIILWNIDPVGPTGGPIHFECLLRCAACGHRWKAQMIPKTEGDLRALLRATRESVYL